MVTFYFIGILMLVHHETVYCESPSSTVPSDTRTTSDTAGLTDTAEYSFRLAHGKYGMVEMKIQNTWGYICPNHFSDADAMVLCRELGYKGGFAYLLIREFDNGMRPTLFSLGCTGTEISISYCNKLIAGNDSACHFDSYAAVHCYNNSGYAFRLVNESTPGYGLVEMAIDGEWRPLCGYQGFDYNSIAIDFICQTLGYSAGNFVSRSQKNPVENVWTTHLSHCEGAASVLLGCPIILVPNEQPYDSRSSANNRYRGRNSYYCTTGLLPTIECF